MSLRMKGMELTTGLVQICRKPTAQRLQRLSVLFNAETINQLYEDSELKQQVLVTLLHIPQKHRTNTVKEIIAKLLADIGCFDKMVQSYGKKAVEELYSCIEPQQEQTGRHLIKIGQNSDKLYIILIGQVIVLYPRADKIVEMETQALDRQFLKTIPKNKRIQIVNRDLLHSGPVDWRSIEGYQQFFNAYGVCLYQKETTLKKGQSFGQLGIIYNQKRMAHIVCSTHCLLAVVSDYRYMSIIEKTQQYGKIYKMMFFIQKYFYKSICQLQLRVAQRFIYMFAPLQKKINSTVIPLYNKFQGVYIVVQGSIALRRQQSSYSKLLLTQTSMFFKHKPKRQLKTFKTLLIGDCIGLTQFIENRNCLEKIKYDYEAVAIANSKLMFCPADKLKKALGEDRKFQQELREKYSQSQEQQNQMNFIHKIEAVHKRPLSEDPPKQKSFPTRYYLQTQHRRQTINSIKSNIYLKKQNSFDFALRNSETDNRNMKNRVQKLNLDKPRKSYATAKSMEINKKLSLLHAAMKKRRTAIEEAENQWIIL